MVIVEAVATAEGWAKALGEEPQSLCERVVAAACSIAASSSFVIPGEPSETRNPGDWAAPNVRANEGGKPEGDVTFLFADDAELLGLNLQFRGKDKPTNVLAFPSPAGFGSLGDVALALETVRAEALDQGKTFPAHATHLIAHGFLHLMGYDHETEEEATIMEACERAVLERLGLPDPYAGDAP
jgi:probable rRNA maturation factor